MTRILLAILFSAASATAVDRGLLELADPDINFAMGVRVAELAESPLLQPLIDEAVAKNPMAADVFATVGRDFLSRCEEALIVGRAEAGGGDAPAQGVVLLRGDFSETPWKEAVCQAGCSSSTYAGVEIHHQTAGEQPRAFAVLDERYAAFGTPQKLQKVIDRRGAAERGDYADALEAWISDLGGSQLWVAAKGPFEVPAEASENPMFSGIAEGLEGFGLGVTVDEDLRIGLEVLADGEAGAKKIYDMAQTLTAMAAMSAASDPEQADAAQFLERLELRQNAARVTASLAIPGDELVEQVRAQMEKNERSGEIAIDGGGEETEAAAAQPEPVETSSGITIHGL